MRLIRHGWLYHEYEESRLPQLMNRGESFWTTTNFEKRTLLKGDLAGLTSKKNNY